MLRITLEQWRMFRAVVEYGGFNQAAQGVHKSQSSIHNSVQKIESTLGVKLFQVRGRKTSLTEYGELMLRRANYLLDEAEKLEAIGVNLADGVETRLRIAIDEVFPQALLYRVLDTVSSQYPYLRIELMESVLRGATHLLENAEVDLAVSPFINATLFNEELCSIDFIAVSSPHHALQQSEHPITFEELRNHRQIVVRDSALGKRKEEGWLGADQRWTVSHMRTSIDMIVNGFGYAWLPIPLIENELKEGKLQPLDLKSGQKRTAQLHLIFADGDQLGPAARAFLGELRYQSMNLPTSENTLDGMD